MKRTGFSLIELLLVVGVLALGAAILLPMFARPRETRRHNGCFYNLKQISIGLAQYAQDFNEQLPPVAITSDTKPHNLRAPLKNWTPYGWADAIFPYIKSVQIYHCQSTPRRAGSLPGNRAAVGYTDYWINSGAAGLGLQKFTSPKQTILFGDGNDGADLTTARYNLPALPAAWITNPNSPSHRHQGGANYAFLDGHVKVLNPQQITIAPPAPGNYTFAIK